MRLLVISIVLSVLVWLGSSSPIDPHHQLIKRPKIYRRSPQKYGLMHVKGQRFGGREYNPTPPPLQRKGYPTPFPQLQKGQYKCGSRVCKLQPGEVPKGCDGMCQYAV